MSVQRLDILHPKIAQYLRRLPTHRDPVLEKMERQADREGFPMIGPQVGQLLMVLTRAIGARRVFEMGSGFGYSGLWFAKALPEDGRVTLTDTSAVHSKHARDYFRESKLEQKAEFLVGDAIELIQQAEGPFDIIFLDADKARYPLAFKVALSQLRPGGCFIADNCLWSGLVLSERPDAETQGILDFTKLIYATPGIVSTVIPLRDGVSLSFKVPGV